MQAKRSKSLLHIGIALIVLAVLLSFRWLGFVGNLLDLIVGLVLVVLGRGTDKVWSKIGLALIAAGVLAYVHFLVLPTRILAFLIGLGLVFYGRSAEKVSLQTEKVAEVARLQAMADVEAARIDAEKAEQVRLEQETRIAVAQKQEQEKQYALRSWREMDEFDSNQGWQIALATRIRMVVVEFTESSTDDPDVIITPGPDDGHYEYFYTYADDKVKLCLRRKYFENDGTPPRYSSYEVTWASVSVCFEGQEEIVYSDYNSSGYSHYFVDSTKTVPASFEVKKFMPGAWIDYIFGPFTQKRTDARVAKATEEARKSEEIRKRIREGF